MPIEDEDEGRLYFVIVNAEEQYAIRRADEPIPLDWSAVGKQGRKSECLQYIEEVWTDMRPLSMRQRARSRQTVAGNNLSASLVCLQTSIGGLGDPGGVHA